MLCFFVISILYLFVHSSPTINITFNCNDELQCEQPNTKSTFEGYLTTKHSFDLRVDSIYPVFSAGSSCNITNAPDDQGSYIGLLECDTECPVEKSIASMTEKSFSGVIVFSRGECKIDGAKIKGIPDIKIPVILLSSPANITAFSGIPNITLKLNLRQEATRGIDSFTLYLVLGFLLLLIFAVLVVLVFIRPWRRIISRSYLNDLRAYNSKKLNIDESKLSIFPTLKYRVLGKKGIKKDSANNQDVSRCSFYSLQLPIIRETIINNSKLSARESLNGNIPNSMESRHKYFSSKRISMPDLAKNETDIVLVIDDPSEPTYYQNNTCAICLGDYQEGENLKVLTCRHAFHSECIDSWILSSNFSGQCPICKMDLSESLGIPKIDTRTHNLDQPIIRFEEILGISMPILVMPTDHNEVDAASLLSQSTRTRRRSLIPRMFL